MPTKILLLDDDPFVLGALSAALKGEVYDVHVCTSPVGVVEEIEACRIDVVVAELEIPGLKPEEFLRTVRKQCPETVTVVLTNNTTVERAVQALRLGVFDYRTKPVKVPEVEAIIQKAAAARALLAPRPAPAPSAPPQASPTLTSDTNAPMTLEQALDEAERKAILSTLTRHLWNRQNAADELGINRTTLYKKMRKHNLDVGDLGPA